MTTWTVEGAGVPLAVTEEGAGRPPVLVLHGMASDAAAWGAERARLAAAGVRVIVPNRRGYAGSGSPEPYGGTTVEEQAEDAAAVLRMTTEEPAIVVGDGFGALIALDLVKRHRRAIAAVALGDPPLFAFVSEAAAALAGERVELEAALRAGGPEDAVARWLGPGTPPDVLARAKKAHRAFFADFAGLASWPVTRRELRAMDVPAEVVTHALAPSHVRAAADALAGLLPGAQRDVDGDLVAAALRLVAQARR